MTNHLLEEFKQAYLDMTRMDISRLDRVYAHTLIFRDPVHQLRGLSAMQDYLVELVAQVHECRFEFLDQLSSEDTAYLKWNMHFRHPRLAGGELLTLRGMSQLQYNDRIFFHEDSYDLGQMLYEHIPLLGGMLRWLKGRLAS